MYIYNLYILYYLIDWIYTYIEQNNEMIFISIFLSIIIYNILVLVSKTIIFIAVILYVLF